ncbi:MAG: phage terminase large subunit [Pseudomonadota bacterium]|jgi:predicted phage terminase large subunit-like protein
MVSPFKLGPVALGLPGFFRCFMDSATIAQILPKLSSMPIADQVELLKLLEGLEDAKGKERAQSNFLPFVKRMWPGFIEGPHHRIMADTFDRVISGECKRVIINMAPRHPLEINTPVLTTDGWKTMGSVAVGDFVFGPDGKPTEVIGKSQIYNDMDLYSVTTDDGAEVICDGDHRWNVRLERKTKKYHTYTTEQLWHREQGARVKTLRSGHIEVVYGERKFNPRAATLPAFSAVEFPDAELLVDPYVLGVWLGDGTSAQAIITMHDDDAGIVRPEIERRGYITTDQSTKMSFGIKGLKVKLRELGVLENKHIPECYLLSSPKQRMDLLKGLMDTDGNVSQNGQCFFSQKSKDFIYLVRRLLWSLGVKNSIQVSRARIYEKDYGETYRLSFYLKNCAFLQRKSERTIHSDKCRFIRIKKLDRTGSTVCIKVARKDEQFMVGHGMLVTLNTKSEFASYLLPAYFMGKYPEKKIIQATHTAELAVDFGRKVRNLIKDEAFSDVFPGVGLRADSTASGRWNTTSNGAYFAVGVGGAIAGKGADLFIIDDPHSEQEAIQAAHDPKVFEKVYEWYSSGPRQRLQPNAAIVVVMTRWGVGDLTGRLVQASIDRGDGDQWEVIELPAILPSGEPMWPAFWSKPALEALKSELPASKWNAQYQQKPTSEEGAIIKREWWRRWDKKRMPQCEYIIIASDTAFTKNNRSDYSAFTVWGVFENEGEGGSNIIMLDAWKDRLEFPDLKAKAIELYKEWEPDTFLIEAKASGLPLIHELRKAGVMVSEFTPTRASGDKVMRANSISDIFASGVVWAPTGNWANEVIEECASFPVGAHDDYVDTVIMALMRYRQGGLLRLPSDDEDDYTPQTRAEYY